MSSEHIFIYRIGNLGDTLVSLPAIRGIAARHPMAKFTLVTNPPHPSYITAWDVLRHTGIFDGVRYLSGRTLPELALELRRGGNSVLYYLTPSRTSWQLLRDWAAFRAIGGVRATYGMREAHTKHHVRRDGNGHLLTLERESERLLSRFGLSVEGVAVGPLLTPPPEAEDRVSELIAPLSDRPLVAVGPGSKMSAKRWFPDRFTAVLQRACDQQPELGIVVIGGPEDEPLGVALAAALGEGRVVNLCGRTNIIESAAAVSRCKVFLGNDTGTMHLAASMGVRCVVPFASRDNPGQWNPWGSGHAILRHEIPCSGCRLNDCYEERMRCLDLVTVDEVAVPLLKALSTAG